MSLVARHLVVRGKGAFDRRSAAGEWALWFALGGGPPDFWEVPGPYVVRGRVLPGGVSARQGCLCGRVVLGWLGAVEDDVLYLAGGVASPD